MKPSPDSFPAPKRRAPTSKTGYQRAAELRAKQLSDEAEQGDVGERVAKIHEINARTLAMEITESQRIELHRALGIPLGKTGQPDEGSKPSSARGPVRLHDTCSVPIECQDE